MTLCAVIFYQGRGGSHTEWRFAQTSQLKMVKGMIKVLPLWMNCEAKTQVLLFYFPKLDLGLIGEQKSSNTDDVINKIFCSPSIKTPQLLSLQAFSPTSSILLSTDNQTPCQCECPLKVSHKRIL